MSVTRVRARTVKSQLHQWLIDHGIRVSISVGGSETDAHLVVGILKSQKPHRKIPDNYKGVPVKVNYITDIGRM